MTHDPELCARVRSPARVAKLLRHYERSFRTDLYPMPDSGLPDVLDRAATLLFQYAKGQSHD